MKTDHRSKFSNLSNWKKRLVEHRTGIAEVTGLNRVEALIFLGFFFPIAEIGKFTAMISLHFDLPPQLRYMNCFIYASHHFTSHGRSGLSGLTSLPMCGFMAWLVEHRTGIVELTGSNPVEALIFSGFFFPMISLNFK